MTQFVTRFAPSPSGRLHLGHVLAAREALNAASDNHGRCYLRMEDIDQTRCRGEYVQGIFEDLAWLGLTFEPKVLFQSQRMRLYEEALNKLKALGVVYPCFCTRKEIAAELALLNNAPQGEVLELYPRTCAEMSEQEREDKLSQGIPYSWRLDCHKAFALTGNLPWKDERFGDFICYPEKLGDVILARKDCLTSYHLAVVVDDAAQGVTLVTRGEDLLQVTGIHRLLQELLGLPVPVWRHHRLVRDATGKRLAKRDKARSIAELRAAGYSPDQVLSMLPL